jgi:hypothetical protein
MALVKEAILRLQVEGFAAAEAAAGNMARSLEAVQKSANTVGQVAASQSAAQASATTATQATAGAMAQIANNATQATTQVQRLGEAATQATPRARGLADAFGRASSAALLGGAVLGASDSPLLKGVAQIAQGAGIGAFFGGGIGALAGGAVAAGGVAYNALTTTDKEAAKAHKLELRSEVHMNRDAFRDAARQASEEIRRNMVRDLEHARGVLFDSVGRSPRLSR